jgi:membrane-associated phospholipid phosphatase
MRRFFLQWFACLAVTVILCGLCIMYLDIPISRVSLSNSSRLSLVGDAFSSSRLIFVITFVIIFLGVSRLIRGKLSREGETVVVAGYSALCAFAVNEYALKPIFSRQFVVDFLSHPVDSGFELFKGNINSGFPSGHAALAAAALLVFARVYSRALPWTIMILLVAAIILLLGDWHFLSDIIAGMFVGGSVGTITGGLMKVHFAGTDRRVDKRSPS